MKYIILTLLLFSQIAHAENWLNESKILEGSIEAHSLQSECERISKEKCYELGSYPSSLYSRALIQVDDESRPIYLKINESSCSSVSDCNAKFSNLFCVELGYEKIKASNKVYCQKLDGYEKKSEATITLDTQKLQNYEAQQVVKAAIGQKEAGLQVALRKIDCGKRVIALMVLRNVPKNLTPQQIAQMNTVYAPIKGLLETASLVTAKSYIEATTADGTLITEAAKSDLAAETQKCIEL